MRDRIQAKIAELKTDFQAGEARLGHLEREGAQLRQTLLRISGAIQALEETLGETDDEAPARQAAE